MASNSMEQATQAMEISEEKLVTGHDLSGAMKLALNARRLYPELKGIDQLISVLEVHLAAANPNDCSGKRDYYKILQVDPQAESSVIKKQYRKIALNVHPDKNSSIRAEEAFKMVIEAFEVLSDQRKRELYDQGRRRGLWEIGKVDMESLFRKMNTKEFWEERKRQMSEREMESLRRMQMSEERSMRRMKEADERMKEAEERWNKENTKREMESLRRMQMSEERSMRRMKEAEERWDKENTKREMESLRRMQMSEERSMRRMKEAEERWDKENTKREMESLRRMQMSEERSMRRMKEAEERMKEAEERWNKENTKREMESLRGKWRV